MKEHISSENIHSDVVVVDDDEVGIATINSSQQSVEQIEVIHEVWPKVTISVAFLSNEQKKEIKYNFPHKKRLEKLKWKWIHITVVATQQYQTAWWVVL